MAKISIATKTLLMAGALLISCSEDGSLGVTPAFAYLTGSTRAACMARCDNKYPRNGDFGPNYTRCQAICRKNYPPTTSSPR